MKHYHLKSPAYKKGISVTYRIQNLSCANCAAKIEHQIKGLTGIQYAHIDFVNQEVSLNVNHLDHDLLKRINQVANRIEPGTKITKMDHLEEEHPHYFRFILLITGIIAFIIAYLLHSVPLFLMAYLFIGYPVVKNAMGHLFHGQLFDENFLMVLATLAAFYIKSYPEAVSVMLFYEIGEWFEALAVNRSRKAITHLLDIKPDRAHVMKNGVLKLVHPNNVKIGEKVLVKPGEKIPLDGVIIEGSSSLDTSSLTGESLPKWVQKGDTVLAGSINFQGVLTIQVQRIYRDSTIQKLYDYVQNATKQKAKVESFITKFARIYTPIVILLALGIVLLPYFFNPAYVFNDYLYRGAIFLVVSCPCALVLSVPLAIFGGIGLSSRLGILIKGGSYLDVIRKVDTLVFDKTGTLTQGTFIVSKFTAYSPFKEADVLRVAALTEQHSNHAIAKAILRFTGSYSSVEEITQEERFGFGVIAKIQGQEIHMGNQALMKELGIEIEAQMGTIIYLSINKQLAGSFVLVDEIKQEASEVLRQLKQLGIKKTVLLTGDETSVARFVGETLNIDEVYGKLLPFDKVKQMEALRRQHPDSCMMYVGDGVNDTVAMTKADVSVAMGALGSDAAIETSDVVIMNDHLIKIVESIKLSRFTHKKVWQNILFALAVKFAILILSAFGEANMWEAVFADVGVTVLAVMNAMTILGYKLK